MSQFILFNINSNASPQLIVRKLLTEIEFYGVEMLQFPFQFFPLPLFFFIEEKKISLLI